MNYSNTLKIYTILSFSLFLNACGGGGGTGGAVSSALNSGTSLSYDSDIPTAYQARAEFDNINTHGASVVTPYETINLHKVLGYGLSGDGQQIMIMDSRFDKDHIAFADKTVTTYGTLAAATSDGSGGYHGNFVAGIAAADYNNNSDPSGLTVVSYSDPSGSVDGMMGVAHNADLFFADYTSANGFDNYGAAWKAATDAASSAIVQNNSWGIEYTIDEVKTYASNNSVSNAYAAGAHYETAGYTMTTEENFQKYIDALDSFQSHGAIVFALTNDTSFANADISAGLPELFPKLKEAWISVGNTEVTGAAGSHTYTRKGGVCGDTAAYCLQADGFEVFSVSNVIGSNHYVQGVHDVTKTNKSGTSFAAPQVSGAIAILKEAFPSSSPEVLVDRLLASADNSYFTASGTTTFSNGITHGYNSEFGHGMLDIYAALQPITTSRMGRTIFVGENLSNSSSKRYSLERSYIDTPSLFGDAFEKNFQNSKGIFHDAMYGTFNYDFSKSFIKDKSPSIEEQLVKHLDNDNTKYAYQTNRTGNLIAKISNSPILQDYYQPEFMFQSHLNETRGYFNSYNMPLELTSGFVGLDDKIVKNKFSDGFNVPFLSNNNLNTYSSGIFLEDLNNTTLSMFYSEDEKKINKSGALLKTNFNNSSFLFGYTTEEGGFLGSKSNEAFYKGTSTPTNFISHKFEKLINNKLNLSSIFSLGYTNVDGFNQSLIENMSDIYSSSWGANLSYEGKNKNMYSFSVSQPHRVEKGNATFLLPKIHSLDGTLNYDREKIKLSPSGREINFSFKLDKEIGTKSKLSLQNITTKNYMHNNDHKLNNQLFVSFKSLF